MKKLMLKFTLVCILVISLPGLTCSQTIGILTNPSILSGNRGQVTSAEIVCEVAGFPSIHFFSLDSIQYFETVILTSAVGFDSNELSQSCSRFINEGGILLADYYSVIPEMYSVFGINNGTKTDIHKSITLPDNVFEDECRWLDDPMEKSIPFSKASYQTSFNVYELGPDVAETMGKYEDGTIGLTNRSTSQNGRAILLGTPLKRIILFPRMNKDREAQRSYSNGFEPAGDIIPLLVRGIIEKEKTDASWIYTLPSRDKGVLIITHDVDSKTGIDTAQYFVALEKEKDIRCHYFITTRYFRDGHMSDYYLQGGKELVAHLIEHDQTIGSHSVGHFLDFGNKEVFPVGSSSVDSLTYHPSYHDGITTNGTVYGEIAVSKQILEKDNAPAIRSFRSGHLAFNKYQPNVLDTVEYSFDSSFSANDIMTGFPYHLSNNLSSTDPLSHILEIPMAISDVFSSDPINAENWREKKEIWLNQIRRYAENHAPVVLLIHPNRQFKVAAQRALIEELPNDVSIQNFEKFGDFWLKREAFRWATSLSDRQLTVTVPSELVPVDDRIRLVLSHKEEFDNVVVLSDTGEQLEFNTTDFGSTSVMLEFFDDPNTSSGNLTNNKNDIKLFPNPVLDQFRIEITGIKLPANLSIRALNGRQVFNSILYDQGKSIDISHLPPSVYLVTVTGKDMIYSSKLIKQ